MSVLEQLEDFLTTIQDPAVQADLEERNRIQAEHARMRNRR